jgi:hypothetical protein
MVKGETLGVLGSRLVFYFPLSKGNRRNLPVLVGTNICTTRFPVTPRSSPAPIGKQKKKIISWLESTLAVFLRRGELAEVGTKSVKTL